MPRKSRRSRSPSRARSFFGRARSVGRSDAVRQGLFAAAYAGLIRPFVATLAKPFSDKLPMGNLNDEAALAVVDFVASKQGGMVGEMGRVGLVIEAASAGSTLAGGMGGAPAASSGGQLRPSLG